LAGRRCDRREVEGLKTGCSESLSVNGKFGHFAIAGNRVHDDNIGIDAIGSEGTLRGVFDQARDGVIRLNRVADITSFGNPDYTARNMPRTASMSMAACGSRSSRTSCTCRYRHRALERGAGHVTSAVTAGNNRVYAANANGISIGGFAAGAGGTALCAIVNNTLFRNDTRHQSSVEFRIQFHATGNFFRNNIAAAGDEPLIVNSFTRSEPHPASLDFNLYDAPPGVAKSRWVWNGVTYRGFA
jgi:hypothetical protein